MQKFTYIFTTVGENSQPEVFEGCATIDRRPSGEIFITKIKTQTPAHMRLTSTNMLTKFGDTQGLIWHHAGIDWEDTIKTQQQVANVTGLPVIFNSEGKKVAAYPHESNVVDYETENDLVLALSERSFIPTDRTML